MTIHLNYGLPFVSVTLQFRGQRLRIENVLLDTGSAGTLFIADVVGRIGVISESNDVLASLKRMICNQKFVGVYTFA